MRRVSSVIAVISLTAFVSSCGTEKNERAEVEPAPSGVTDEKLDVAIAATQVATHAIEGYAFEQREKFKSDRKAELLAMQAELDRLSVKAESASDAAKADLTSKLDAVRAKWAEAKRRLDQAESATESDWEEVQGGFDKSYGEFRAAFDEVRQLLSDKIEP